VRSAAFGRFALFRRFRFHDGLCAQIPVVPAALGSDTSANPGFRFERSQTDLATNACAGQSRISLVARIRIDRVAGIIGSFLRFRAVHSGAGYRSKTNGLRWLDRCREVPHEAFHPERRFERPSHPLELRRRRFDRSASADQLRAEIQPRTDFSSVFRRERRRRLERLLTGSSTLD
jgi:hypothetical protein